MGQIKISKKSVIPAQTAKFLKNFLNKPKTTKR